MFITYFSLFNLNTKIYVFVNIMMLIIIIINIMKTSMTKKNILYLNN